MQWQARHLLLSLARGTGHAVRCSMKLIIFRGQAQHLAFARRHHHSRAGLGVYGQAARAHAHWRAQTAGQAVHGLGQHQPRDASTGAACRGHPRAGQEQGVVLRLYCHCQSLRSAERPHVPVGFVRGVPLAPVGLHRVCQGFVQAVHPSALASQQLAPQGPCSGPTQSASGQSDPHHQSREPLLMEKVTIRTPKVHAASIANASCSSAALTAFLTRRGHQRRCTCLVPM